jgi:pimeloyl-ACP methyl ester carboxylesterase
VVPSVRVVADAGEGRPWIVLLETGSRYHSAATEAVEQLRLTGRTLLLEMPVIRHDSWKELSRSLTEVLKQHQVKHASFLAFGAAGTLVQAAALELPKLVRTVVFVHPATRSHPSLRMRLIDRVERALPLGLPLRSGGEAFDGMPFLQRIRCPVLLVLSSGASAYDRTQGEIMAAGLPTAWIVELDRMDRLGQLLDEFQQVAVKCPQKGGGRAGRTNG